MDIFLFNRAHDINDKFTDGEVLTKEDHEILVRQYLRQCLNLQQINEMLEDYKKNVKVWSKTVFNGILPDVPYERLLIILKEEMELKREATEWDTDCWSPDEQGRPNGDLDFANTFVPKKEYSYSPGTQQVIDLSFVKDDDGNYVPR